MLVHGIIYCLNFVFTMVITMSFFQLKALGIDNILGFDWPAPPAPEAMVRALEVLYLLGVIDDDAKLTSPIGFQIAEIPLVCHFSTNFSH